MLLCCGFLACTIHNPSQSAVATVPQAFAARCGTDVTLWKPCQTLDQAGV
jgi:hypothetical protein